MIYVDDLFELGDARGVNAFLLCEDCGTRASATKGDYFWMPADRAFECCGEPMVLARELRHEQVFLR